MDDLRIKREWVDEELADKLAAVIKEHVNGTAHPKGIGVATLAKMIVGIVLGGDEGLEVKRTMTFEAIRFILDLHNNGYGGPAAQGRPVAAGTKAVN